MERHSAFLAKPALAKAGLVSGRGNTICIRRGMRCRRLIRIGIWARAGYVGDNFLDRNNQFCGVCPKDFLQ